MFQPSDKTIALALLLALPGIGRKTVSKLILAMAEGGSSWYQVWCNSDLRVKMPLSKKQRWVIEQVKHPKKSWQQLVTTLQREHIYLLGQEDALYPSLLKQITDPPLILYARGNLQLLRNWLRIAVVGTRKMTRYGEDVTQKLVTSLIKEGSIIVSGGMYGVDRCAHQAALQAGGATITVLGTGLMAITQPWQIRLCQIILKHDGLLISEFPLHMPALPAHFPLRNRIVAGISDGVLVTEAAAQSGSLITAHLAAEYGREVWAVPGPITSEYSTGTRDLVNEGALLVASATEILEPFLGKKRWFAG